MTSELKARFGECDALITTWDCPFLEADLPQFASRLRIIAHCGGEVKARFAIPLFDVLTITNAAGPMARATAELGATLLLYSARNIDFYRAQLREPDNHIYGELHDHGSLREMLAGREVSLIGFGRVGRSLVELLSGFEIRWLVYDPHLDPEMARRYLLRTAPLESVLKRGELLVLAAALTEQTRYLLNRERLALLPNGAVVINIARGGLIDLDALVSEVAAGRLRCALDVTDPLEPLPIDHSLRNMPGSLVTPHIAGSGRHVRRAIATTVMDDLDRFFRNEPVENRVTRSMLDWMT